MNDEKLDKLLELVIENYISKGDPVWSKFLYSLEMTTYAPSTLRKYLNILEQDGLLYQPYNSAWRIPTLKGFSIYIENLLEDETSQEDIENIDFKVNFARTNLKFIVDKLGMQVDWAVVGFLQNDEYYFLGINNLIKEELIWEYETIKDIVKFIEEKQIIQVLNSQQVEENHINFSFIKFNEKTISCLYLKININWYFAMITVLWPVRVDYKKNLATIRKFLKVYNRNLNN